MLIAAGADSNAPAVGDEFAQTLLHWAASSDDVDVAEALVDLGAELEAPNGSIAKGTPLTVAVGYGCWHERDLPIARCPGTRPLDRSRRRDARPRRRAALPGAPTTQDELSHALWQATHGGQRRMVEYLAGLGADVNWTPHDAPDSPLDIAKMADTRREAVATWLSEHGGCSAAEAKEVVQ